MSIYLDYSATTPVDPRVLEAMVDVYQNHFGNPDSRTHNYGNDARQLVENARAQVAQLMGVKRDEVLFTSGATESSNIAILGLVEHACKTNKRHIITTSVEHKAVLEATKYLQTTGFVVDYISPDESGRISLNQIAEKIRDDTLLVSVMHANNETGVIQPVKEIGDYLVNKGVLFHIDATQTAGKLVDELREIKYSMMSLGAHKMYGPQGVGALILRKTRYRLPPVKGIMYGGSQEHGIRPGTIPVALTVGLGKACEILTSEYTANYEGCCKIKQRVIELIDGTGVKYYINGDQQYCMPNTLNVSFPGVSSEAVMLATKQYCGISNGSACNSHSYSGSYVLSAMGIPQERIQSALRLSWSHNTNLTELSNELTKLLETVKQFL